MNALTGNNLGVNVDRHEVGTALREIAEKHWEEWQAPVLLSALTVQLQAKLGNSDFKKALGGTIKSFIKKSEAEFGYQLIEHPTQQAKLGLAPQGVHYQFSFDAHAEKIEPNDGEDFVRILAKLSVEELQNISIPASVIVKLFGKK